MLYHIDDNIKERIQEIVWKEIDKQQKSYNPLDKRIHITKKETDVIANIAMMVVDSLGLVKEIKCK